MTQLNSDGEYCEPDKKNKMWVTPSEFFTKTNYNNLLKVLEDYQEEEILNALYKVNNIDNSHNSFLSQMSFVRALKTRNTKGDKCDYIGDLLRYKPISKTTASFGIFFNKDSVNP